MSIILDLTAIAIILVFTFISAKKGFVRSLIEIVGLVLVIMLANAVSTPLANATYDKLIQPSIIEAGEKLVAENQTDIVLAVDVLPGFLQKILGDTDVLNDFKTQASAQIGKGVTNGVAVASQSVIKPVVANVISILYSLIIITVLLFVVHFLARVINKLFSFSLIGKANLVLGGALGLIKGVIIIYLICYLVNLFVPLTKNGFLIFTPSNIENSFIFNLFS